MKHRAPSGGDPSLARAKWLALTVVAGGAGRLGAAAWIKHLGATVTVSRRKEG